MANDEQQAMTSERLAEINSLTADVVAGRIHARFDEETAWLAILDARREVERLRAREAELVAMAIGAARLDDRDNIICECRLTMPVGHHDGCWLLIAQRIAHTLPSGEIE